MVNRAVVELACVLARVLGSWRPGSAGNARLLPFEPAHCQFVLLATATWYGDSELTQERLRKSAALIAVEKTERVLRACRSERPTLCCTLEIACR